MAATLSVVTDDTDQLVEYLAGFDRSNWPHMDEMERERWRFEARTTLLALSRIGCSISGIRACLAAATFQES